MARKSVFPFTSHVTSHQSPSFMAARKVTFSIICALVVALIVGGMIYERRPQFYPYVTIQAIDSLRITFLERAHQSLGQCQLTANRVAEAMLAHCTICRLLENRCLDKLEPQQSKILGDQPADVPVMRTSHGVVAFVSDNPELANEVCRESERQSASKGPARCIAASVASTAVSFTKADGNADATVMPTFSGTLGLILFAAVMSLVASYLVLRPRRLNIRSNIDITASSPAISASGVWAATQVIKRGFDFVLAIVLLIILSPLLVLASLLILVFEGKPVFYISQRYISASKSVPIFKFRTMVKDATDPKHLLNERFMHDGFLDIPLTCEIYTPIGRFLERTQLVETPQLLNILFHGMSFVGNRPLPAANIAHLKTVFPRWAERFDSPAGITGIAQVVGRRNLISDERIELESLYSLVYQHGNILKCDLKIILITAWVVLFAKGIMISQARELLRSCLPKEMRVQSPVSGD